MVSYGLLLVSLPVLSLWGLLCRFPCLSLLEGQAVWAWASCHSLRSPPEMYEGSSLFSRTCVTSLFGSSFRSGPEALSHSDFDENLPSSSIASNHIPFEPSCVCLSCVISQVPFPPSLPLHPCPLNKISHRPGKSQVGCLVTEPRGLPVSAFLELGV